VSRCGAAQSSVALKGMEVQVQKDAFQRMIRLQGPSQKPLEKFLVAEIALLTSSTLYGLFRLILV